MSLIMLANLAWGKHYLVQTANRIGGNYGRGNDYAADIDTSAEIDSSAGNDYAAEADYVTPPPCYRWVYTEPLPARCSTFSLTSHDINDSGNECFKSRRRSCEKEPILHDPCHRWYCSGEEIDEELVRVACNECEQYDPNDPTQVNPKA